jgi:rare lipoprotein A
MPNHSPAPQAAFSAEIAGARAGQVIARTTGMPATRLFVCAVLCAMAFVGCADEETSLGPASESEGPDAGSGKANEDGSAAAPIDGDAADAGAPGSPDAASADSGPVLQPTGPTTTCKASYYQSGSKTANGEAFDPDGMTAAHKTLPFNTMLRVTNPTTGASVDVRINDRGPFSGGRCLDLARGAFAKIAPLSAGVVTVDYVALK